MTEPLVLATPWPPQRNGIADYAFELARWMETLCVVTEAPAARPARERHRLLTPRGFLAEATPAPIYHIGNNPDHVFLVPLFLRRPGVVVLHDLSLHYLVRLVERELPGFFAAQLRHEPPAVAALLARLGPAGLSRDLDHREIRLLGWLRAAPAIIVHSQAARRLLAAEVPRTPIVVVPHFCFLPGPGPVALEAWRDAVRDPARESWMSDVAFSAAAFVIVSLGARGADRQLGAVIAAIAALPAAARSQTVLLVAGAAQPGDPDISALAARHGCADRVRVLGWLDEAQVDRLLLAADLVLALRLPTRGESSGVVARSLGLGCATVVSDHGSYAELPDEAVIKLPARFDVTGPLRGLIGGLIDDRSRIVRTRRAAWRYAQGVGDPATAARRHAAVAAGR